MYVGTSRMSRQGDHLTRLMAPDSQGVEKIRAVVLAGGQGARLAPYTRVLPKPLLPVGDRPILEIIVGQLRDSGITEIVLATGYLSSLIETYFGDGTAFGVDIAYHREDRQLGTVGPLGSIAGLDHTFILMNGDVLTTPFYEDLLAAHRRTGALATVATRLQEIDIDYGVLGLGEQIDGTRRILGIDEKPRYSWPVSTGVYVFEPRVRDFVKPGVKMDFPELMGRLIASDEVVAAYEHDGYWMDIGQLHNLEAAVQDFEGSAEEFVSRRKPDPRELLSNGRRRRWSGARLARKNRAVL
jgi:NDP-sugar pyrophosphorylase family protein